jgi:hypothetical protein
MKSNIRIQLALLRVRYDCGAVSPAIYGVIKELEVEQAWRDHHRAQNRLPRAANQQRTLTRR